MAGIMPRHTPARCCVGLQMVDRQPAAQHHGQPGWSALGPAGRCRRGRPSLGFLARSRRARATTRCHHLRPNMSKHAKSQMVAVSVITAIARGYGGGKKCILSPARLPIPPLSQTGCDSIACGILGMPSSAPSRRTIRGFRHGHASCRGIDGRASEVFSRPLGAWRLGPVPLRQRRPWQPQPV